MALTWLKFPGGSTFALSLNWRAQDGAPLDLTGATLTSHLYATLSDSLASTNALATLTHTATGASSASLVFAASATANWQAPSAPYYRAKVVQSDNTAREVFGRLWLIPFVSDPSPLAPGDTLVTDSALTTAALLTVSGILNLPNVTGWVGGASTDLDAVAIAGYSTGTIFSIVINDTIQHWQIQTSANAGAASGSAPYEVVQTTDYNASTNDRRLVLV